MKKSNVTALHSRKIQTPASGLERINLSYEWEYFKQLSGLSDLGRGFADTRYHASLEIATMSELRGDVAQTIGQIDPTPIVNQTIRHSVPIAASFSLIFMSAQGNLLSLAEPASVQAIQTEMESDSPTALRGMDAAAAKPDELRALIDSLDADVASLQNESVKAPEKPDQKVAAKSTTKPVSKVAAKKAAPELLAYTPASIQPSVKPAKKGFQIPLIRSKKTAYSALPLNKKEVLEKEIPLASDDNIPEVLVFESPETKIAKAELEARNEIDLFSKEDTAPKVAVNEEAIISAARSAKAGLLGAALIDAQPLSIASASAEEAAPAIKQPEPQFAETTEAITNTTSPIAVASSKPLQIAPAEEPTAIRQAVQPVVSESESLAITAPEKPMQIASGESSTFDFASTTPQVIPSSEIQSSAPVETIGTVSTTSNDIPPGAFDFTQPTSSPFAAATPVTTVSPVKEIATPLSAARLPVTRPQVAPVEEVRSAQPEMTSVETVSTAPQQVDPVSEAAIQATPDPFASLPEPVVTTPSQVEPVMAQPQSTPLAESVAVGNTMSSDMDANERIALRPEPSPNPISAQPQLQQSYPEPVIQQQSSTTESYTPDSPQVTGIEENKTLQQEQPHRKWYQLPRFNFHRHAQKQDRVAQYVADANGDIWPKNPASFVIKNVLKVLNVVFH